MIAMHNSSTVIKTIYPQHGDYSAVLSASTWACFSAEAQTLCDDLSQALLADREAREQSDIVALAYWLRAANIKNIQQEFESSGERQAIGLAFHIAPANVDTVFVYSMILAYLLGNPSVVRLSERLGLSANCIVRVLNTFNNDERLAGRISLIQYPHNEEITQRLSDDAALRVIWGGDQTIKSIQGIELNSICKDIIFPDRYSATLLDAKVVLTSDISALVNKFLQDFLPFNQQACSSPKTLYWLGDEFAIADAKNIFWQCMAVQASNKMSLSDAEQYQRECYKQQVALELGCNAKFNNKAGVLTVECQHVSEELERQHNGQYVLFEINIKNYEELKSCLHDNFQSLLTLLPSKELKISKVRRLARVGESLSFHHYWDGINMLSELSRGLED